MRCVNLQGTSYFNSVESSSIQRNEKKRILRKLSANKLLMFQLYLQFMYNDNTFYPYLFMKRISPSSLKG